MVTPAGEVENVLPANLGFYLSKCTMLSSVPRVSVAFGMQDKVAQVFLIDPVTGQNEVIPLQS